MSKLNHVNFLEAIMKLDLSPFILAEEDIERSLVDVRTEVIEQAVRKVAALNERNAEAAVILELTRRCAKLEAKLAAMESELSSLPAKWSEDSSLKTWFPITSDELESLREEVSELRAYKEAAEKQEPVAWGAFYFGGKYRGQLYSHALSEEQIEDYIAYVHRSNDSITLRKEGLYTKPVPADKPVTRRDIIDILLSTRGQSEGITADAILGLLSDKGATTVPDAIRLLPRVAASTVEKPDHWAVMSPGRADQYRAESVAVRKELGFSADSDEVAPIDLLNAIRQIRADRSRITEQDAREIAESCLAYWLYKHPMEFHVGDWLSTRGRTLLNELNEKRDHEQVLDDTSDQRLWDYYQTLLKHYGFDGITDLLVKYHKLVEQVPAVSVPDGWKLVPCDPTRYMIAAFSIDAPEDQKIEAISQIGKCWTAMLASSPSHSQQSAECSMVRNEVIRFLLGEGELDGLWFGEKFNGLVKVNPFWWRKHLPKLNADSCLSHEGEQGGEV